VASKSVEPQALAGDLVSLLQADALAPNKNYPLVMTNIAMENGP
jgi:hypothetical protein